MLFKNANLFVDGQFQHGSFLAAIAATMSPIFISIALISFSFLFARAGFSIMVLHDFRFCPAAIEKTPAAC